jgi:thiamine kinase-like enzyme
LKLDFVHAFILSLTQSINSLPQSIKTIIIRVKRLAKDGKDLMELDVLQLCVTRVESLGYRNIRSVKRQGPFAAAIIDVYTDRGEHLIYKQPPADRKGELRLVVTLGHVLGAWLPPGIRCFEETPAALLMMHAGEPLFVSQTKAASNDTLRRQALTAVSEKLATLHLQTQSVVEEWVREGKAAPYAYSREWADWSLTRIGTIQLPGKALCQAGELEALQDLANRFYDGYHHRAMRGPRVFTHGDPHWGNILLREDEVAFIDWEWCNAATPMRDIAVLLLDEPDESLFENIANLHAERLLEGGYRGRKEDLRHDFERMLLDNALMSLGWDVDLYLRRELTEDELRSLMDLKCNRIHRFWKQVAR